ncbi:MAG: hypothetical protein SNJ56_05470, partial [Termitinemataceae bacterium]
MNSKRSLRSTLIFLELVMVLFTTFFFLGFLNYVQIRNQTDFTNRRAAELSAIEMLLLSRLEHATANLERLVTQDNLAGGSFISELSDLYLLDNTYRIISIIKQKSNSAVFTGFMFSDVLRSFFESHYHATVKRSPVIYAPEDEKPALYLSIPWKDHLLVGSIPLDTLKNDIARLIQFDGSIVVITSYDGIPFTSIGGNLPGQIFREESGTILQLGNQTYMLNRISSIWLNSYIVLLTPTQQLTYFTSRIQIFGILILVVFFSLLLFRYLVLDLLYIRPIQQFIQQLNTWNINTELPVVPLSIQGLQEIQLLSQTFYTKAQEILRMNEQLQEQVTTVSEQLKNALDKVLVSEKLAVLGNLTAGLAHELNTPLGAIISTAETIKNAIITIKKDICDLLSKNDPSESTLFIQLLQNADKKQSSLRERLQFIHQLEEHQIVQAESVTDDLIDMEINITTPDLVSQLAATSNSAHVVKTAYYFHVLEKDNTIIQTAAERAALTLKALKQWSYDEKDIKKPVSIREEMDTILTMYYNKTKYSVQVVKEYMDEGWVLANPDRLNAVWVNLINNALQAMENKGTLTIRIEKPAQIPDRI